MSNLHPAQNPSALQPATPEIPRWRKLALPRSLAAAALAFAAFGPALSAQSLTLTCNPSTGPTTIGVAYLSTCTASGGVQPYSFFNSPPPSGMTVLQSSATTVQVSGTPTQTGAYSFVVEVRDTSITAPPGGQSFIKTFSGTITSGVQPLTFTCSPSTGPTTVGVAYMSTCTASGGVQPYNFFNSPPPSGLTVLQSSATTVQVSGTPTQTGSYSFVVEVRDTSITAPPGGLSATFTFSGTITSGGPSPLTFTCNPSSGPTTVGVAYTSTCTASGGTPPYSFTTTTPPTGLTVVQPTSTTVRVSGTPTQTGPYSFTIEARDNSNTAPPGGQRASKTFSGTLTSGTPLSISLSSSPNPSLLGQQVTLTATISPQSAASPGVVTFYDGATLVGSAPAGSDGRATLTTSLLPSGVRSLRAYSSGNGNLAGRSSSVISHTVTSNPGGGFSTPNFLLTGVGPVAVTVGDFNRDGIADLAVANRDADSVSVLLGSGNGSFQKVGELSSGSEPVGVAVADIDGDRNPDLVVLNSLSSYVSVHRGNGNGSFQTATNYDTGGGPNSVAVGDFNLDGYPDLAFTKTSGVGVLLGLSGGTFNRSYRDYAAGQSPASVVVGDFDRDGKPDLAVANIGGNSVSVLKGDGTGVFRAPASYPVGTSPIALAVMDFNSDGVLDLAVANIGSSDVTVLAGVADGMFFNYGAFPAGTASSSVAVGDFNGDGIDDLVVGNRNSDNVSILLGTRGQFQTAVNYPAGAGPRSVAVADYNRDGRADVAAANFGSGGVSVLLATGVVQPITASPTMLAFSAAGGSGVPLSQTVTLSPRDPSRVVNFRTSVATSGGGNWLSVSPSSGNVASSPVTLNVSVNPSNLMVGTYTGTVSILPEQFGLPLSLEGAPQQTAPLATIAVSLTITSCPPATLSPTGRTHGPGAESGTIDVTVPAGCPWTASAPGLPWITLRGAGAGGGITMTGPARITYDISANTTGAVRNSGLNFSVGGAIFSITQLAGATGVAPSFAAGAVVNAASFFPGAIAPGEIISIFGQDLGPNPGVGGVLDSNGAVALSLGGTQVLFDGVPGAMFFSSASQLNVQASYSIAGKQSVEMRIVRDGVSSPGVTVPVAPSAPGFFTANGALIALKADGSLITNQNPARPGDVIILWATGEGQTNPFGRDGALSAPPFPRPLLPVTVTVGGQAAQVAFAGAAPGFSGLFQINVVLGQATGTALPVELRIGDKGSQPGLTLPVQ